MYISLLFVRLLAKNNYESTWVVFHWKIMDSLPSDGGEQIKYKRRFWNCIIHTHKSLAIEVFQASDHFDTVINLQYASDTEAKL